VLPVKRRREVLDAGLRAARGSSVTNHLWAQRIEWLDVEVQESKGKTYIAALGAALLAKAIDEEVDTLTQNTKGGVRSYSMRSIGEFMQRQLRGCAHLGTTSDNPLNNSPFLRGPARIDQFTVAPYLKHVYDEFVAWMGELNYYSTDEALQALVIFLRIRMAVQGHIDADATEAPHMGSARSAEDLIVALHRWITEDPEEGGRGQALVAAVLSLAWDDIEVVPKHHPAPFDVRRVGDPPPLVVEVKQRPIDDRAALELARRARAASAEAAIYAAFAVNQSPLSTSRLRSDALRMYGVLLDVVHDTGELTARAATYGGIGVLDMLDQLPDHVARLAAASDVGSPGLQRLRIALSKH
jgi:hypothetical protein